MQSHHDIALIGGGAAGVLVAIHCLRRARGAQRIVLIDPCGSLANGIAYATERPEHLLNVPTGRMSAFADQPGDFLDWLHARPAHTATDRHALAHGYAQRREYGAYLRDRLQQARAGSAATLEVVQARVDELHPAAAGWSLRLSDGGTLQADKVLLATGNAPRPLPVRGSGALAAPLKVDAWDYSGVAAIPAEAEVCIVGTGLSMADAVLTLAANEHTGAIHLVSRHALLPLAHSPEHAVADDVDPQALLALPLRARLRRLREHAREAVRGGRPWQSVMERLRPHGQALWRSLSPQEQRRFLRHAVRYWDIHRHRVAPAVGATLDRLKASGQLRLHRARLDLAMVGERCVQLGARTHDGRALGLDVDRVINATGLELRIQAMRNPLLDALVGHGQARPGPHGIGLASDDAGRVIGADGQPASGLRVIGSLRVGDLWESIAIPELRVQAETIARDWTDAAR